MQIPKLTTIADLDVTGEHRSALISRAMSIVDIYFKWKSYSAGGYSYMVHIGGAKERPPGVHASELAKCLKQVVYNLRGEERRIPVGEARDVNMQMRFDHGHAVHAMLQKEFALMCDWMNEHAGEKIMTFEDEVKISPELQEISKQWSLHSSCDGVFTFWHRDVAYMRVGAEIKTKSGPEFEKLKRPDEDHALQTCFYMAALDLPLMWIPYYNKSNCNITRSDAPFLFQFDRNLWQKKLLPDIESAHRHVQAKTLPEKVEGRHCNWCPFKYTCQPNALRYESRNAIAHSPGAFKSRTVKT